MVNYQDPLTIAQEFGTCPFSSALGPCSPNNRVRLFNSGACEALACCEWHIYVSRPVLPRHPSA